MIFLLYSFPTIDGSFIPDAPSKLVRDGSFSKNVSVIMGWNENDGSLLIPSPLQLTSEKALRLFLTDKYTAMTSCSIDQILELFPLVDFPGQLGPVLNVSGQYFRASQIVRDIMFTCPAIGFSHAVSKHGSTAYLYTLNQTALTSIFASLGASWFGGKPDDSFLFSLNPISLIFL